jgi:Cu2+-exporting ATPase
MFRDKFWLSLLLTIPTLIWGHMLPRFFGYAPPKFPGSYWVAPAFGAVVYLYGGSPFVRGAIRELRDRLPGMMTLIALAITVAFVWSAAVTLGAPGMPLWEELATLVTIMLLGHWIEMRSINQAQGALKELAKLLPNTAVRVIADPAGESRGERTGRWRRARGNEQCQRIDDHWGEPVRREGGRGRSHRWHGERWRLSPRGDYWHG